MHAALSDRPEIEYLAGSGHPKMSPKRTHAQVQLALARIIQDQAGERGVVGTEWRFRLLADPRTEFVPDVAFVSRERLRALAPLQREEPPFAPDIAAEVRSPGEPARVRNKKIADYLAHGSVLVLDVDPKRRMVAAHAADGTQVIQPGAMVQHSTIPWLRFDPAGLFAALDVS